MLPEDLQCLKTIGLLGGYRSQVWISSQRLAASLQTSPQTASRRLKSLEDQRMITRIVRTDGQHVVITKRGEDVLTREMSDYHRILDSTPSRLVLQGSVISGLGEGRYYMSLPHYQKQFSEALGYVPFPGTLNLHLDLVSIETRKKMEGFSWIPIEGFTAENRTFGEARCIACQIKEIPCAIVVPGRSHYPEDIIEVISAVELRRTLDVGEKDLVTVEVEV
jgi:CTP-dependent riboflavin kinase (EC 2.7.1.-)